MTSPEKRDYETELLSVVAHDLKSPVGAARGFLDLVEHFGELTKDQEYYLNKAQVALNRMEQLIASMLNFARVEAGIAPDLQSVDMRDLINDTLSFLNDVAEQHGLMMTVTDASSPGNEPIVLADPNLLSHVIQNLLSNAIKYNKKEGKIEVIVRRQGAIVRVDVRDTGIGIPVDALPHVFERFYRAHKEQDGSERGSGLGLSITKAVITLHNGEIWVESVEGVGSTFSFTLPSYHDEDEPTSTESRRHYNPFPSEVASESSDAVDDSTQESMDAAENESRRDAP